MDLSQISPYKTLDFYARQVVEGFITGRHKSPFHGFSVEFSDYRQYNPGESTRNIDYRLYGRTDRLYVKQFEEETNLRCQILIDHSGSMLYPLERHGDIAHPNKLTFAVYAAAVLIELLHRQRDAFGLSLFPSPSYSATHPLTHSAPQPLSNSATQQLSHSATQPLSNSATQNPLFSTPCRSSRLHQQYLLSELDKLLSPSATQPPSHSATQPLSHSATQTLAQAIHLLAEQLHRRSLVVIFTDALTPADHSSNQAITHSSNQAITQSSNQAITHSSNQAITHSNNQAISQSSNQAITQSSNQSITHSSNQEALFDALRHLRHNKHEVILFHTYDLAHEVNLDFDARPHLFIDLETQRQVRLQPSDLADAYRRQMTDLFDTLRQRAMQYRIDYVPLDIAQGFHQLLLPFLLKRSKNH